MSKILEQRCQARLDKSGRDAALLELHEIAVRVLCGTDSENARARALVQVDKWERDELCNPRYVAQWRSILALPAPAMKAAILSNDAEGVALRQNSPLGFLF